MKDNSKKEKPALRDLLRNTLRLTTEIWRLDKLGSIARLILICIQIAAALLATYFASKTIGQIGGRLAGDMTITARHIYTTIIIAGLLGVLDQIVWRFMDYFDRLGYLEVGRWAQISFRRKLAEIDTSFFEDREFSKLINKVEQKADWAISAYSYNVFYLIHGILRISTISIVLAQLTWWLLPILLLASVPSFITQARGRKVEWGIWGEEGDSYHRYYGTVSLFRKQQSLQELKILGIKDYLLNDIALKMLEKFHKKQRASIKRYIAPSILARFGETAVIVVTELWMLSQLLIGKLTLTSFSFYTGAITQFNSAVGLLMGTVERMYEQALYVNDLYTLLDTKTKLVVPESPVLLSKDVLPEIEFCNVTFCYPDSTRAVFKNLSLKIAGGEDIALVGENGAGKSTFIKLLLRFYDPEEGTILVDGIDIKSLDINSWYRHISALFQNFNQYPFDIYENIRLGQIKKTDDSAVQLAAKQAGLLSMLDQLPDGLHTILDSSFEKGIEPSGGQWQRVALARAFYRSANILILDEPTAAIDANAEYEIFNAIFKHQKERTTLIISHRFSTVRNADRIIVLDKGRVIQDGSHAELIKDDGLYREMFTKQAEGYL